MDRSNNCASSNDAARLIACFRSLRLVTKAVFVPCLFLCAAATAAEPAQIHNANAANLKSPDHVVLPRLPDPKWDSNSLVPARVASVQDDDASAQDRNGPFTSNRTGSLTARRASTSTATLPAPVNLQPVQIAPQYTDSYPTPAYTAPASPAPMVSGGMNTTPMVLGPSTGAPLTGAPISSAPMMDTPMVAPPISGGAGCHCAIESGCGCEQPICECSEPVCGCESVSAQPVDQYAYEPTCGCPDAPSCGCEFIIESEHEFAGIGIETAKTACGCGADVSCGCDVLGGALIVEQDCGVEAMAMDGGFVSEPACGCGSYLPESLCGCEEVSIGDPLAPFCGCEASVGCDSGGCYAGQNTSITSTGGLYKTLTGFQMPSMQLPSFTIPSFSAGHFGWMNGIPLNQMIIGGRPPECTYFSIDFGLGSPFEQAEHIGNTANAFGGTPFYDLNSGSLGSMAIGWDFNQFRIETEVGLRRTSIDATEFGNGVRSTDVFNVDGWRRSTTFMLNGYLDLKNGTYFTPFIKAGMGISRNTARSNYAIAVNSPAVIGALGLPGATSFSGAFPEDSQTRFAWCMGAGFALDLTRRVKFDVEYQFLDAGRSTTGFDSNGDALRFGSGGTHEATFGFRFYR